MIQCQAITHIPLSQYAFINSETNITIRLRCEKNNLLRCILFFGDRVYPKDPIVFSEIEMEIIASDLYFDYFDATFESPYTRICYYFKLISSDESLYLFADLFSDTLPLERSEFYQYPFLRREEISTVPDWLKHAVVYNIFPDSFASSKRSIKGEYYEKKMENGLVLKSRVGGTLKGIIENLDYIAQLGFNCIYLNPIFVAGEYHKYDLLDYFHVAPNMGTDEEFAELVDTAHNMGIRVVIDGVFNHCSWYFFAFDDVVRNGQSSIYKNWFYDLQFPVIRPDSTDIVPTYSCFAYERKMPKLNTSHPEVKEYFMKACFHWIDKFHVDGWRLDVANEVDRNFWREFKQTGKRANKDSVMIGEIWESAESWLEGDMFDSTMNYDFRRHCRDFFAHEAISAVAFNARVTQMHMRYPTGVLHGQLNLLDSHDVNRFLFHCKNKLERFRLAVIFLFCAPGIPCVFYGDELGIAGGDEFSLRDSMPWDMPYSDERPLFSALSQLRKNDVLVYGNYSVRAMDERGLYIFERSYQGKSIIVALNARVNSVSIESRVPLSEPILSYAFKNGFLQAYGYALWKI